MFVPFFTELRKAGIPVSLREYLTLLEALDNDLAGRNIDQFYFLSRSALVKDERNLDKFDGVFSSVFKGLEQTGDDHLLASASIPEDWLRALNDRYLTDEEKAEIEALGGWEKLMETLQKRLDEQEKKHRGGSKWIGTGGTSPFGNSGYNPEGIRIGGHSRHKRAVKVWEKRQFRNLDGDVELGTRNIKMALRKLRQFAREGTPDEFDLGGTVDATAKSGYLDIRMRPERRNTVKVLILFDIGGSMDPYVTLLEELFSAARAEFRHLEYYYFHNCLYDFMWKNNARRWQEKIPTWDVLHTYGSDYKVIIVGDASMSPYEITVPGGSVEYFNEEAGAVWLDRLTQVYGDSVWLNPTPESSWEYGQSIQLIRELMDNRMYPLTLDGLDRAIVSLKR